MNIIGLLSLREWVVVGGKCDGLVCCCEVILADVVSPLCVSDILLSDILFDVARSYP